MFKPKCLWFCPSQQSVVPRVGEGYPFSFSELKPVHEDMCGSEETIHEDVTEIQRLLVTG